MPSDLSPFAFLIGTHRCEARLKRGEGVWENLTATWEGRYILDGYAIADEYRMWTLAGELLVLGMNFRSYDSDKKIWVLKWLNGLTGTWLDLGSDELGGIKIDEKEIRYAMRETVASHGFTRATYTNITENRFRWIGEKSDDAIRWEEFLVIECERT